VKPDRVVRLFLCAAGVFLGLLGAELTLRALDAAQPSFESYSPTRGWQFRPGYGAWQSREGRAYVAINSGGFRGPETALAKPEGILRIAVLGDSFAAGIHVPYQDTFTAVLQRELERDCPELERGHVEVLDFGVSGYSTTQELLTLREHVWRYAPDMVVLAVFTGNDIADNSPVLETGARLAGETCRPYVEERNGALLLRTDFSDGGVWSFYCRLSFTGRRLALLRILGDSARNAGILLRKRLSYETGPPGAEAGLDDGIYGPPADAAHSKAWEVTERLIATIADEVTSRQARFLTVTLSNPVQVYPDTEYRRRYLGAIGGTDIFYPERRIQALGKRHRFDVLALGPPMQRDADRQHVFFHGFEESGWGHGHWNTRGHEFAGRMIARSICEKHSDVHRRPPRTRPTVTVAASLARSRSLRTGERIETR